MNGTSYVQNAEFERSAPSAQDPGQYTWAFKVRPSPPCTRPAAAVEGIRAVGSGGGACPPPRVLIHELTHIALHARAPSPQFNNLNITGSKALNTRVCITIILTESLPARCDILTGAGRTMPYYFSESQQEYCCSRCTVAPGRYVDGP